jgi:hypothetical protein
MTQTGPSERYHNMENHYPHKFLTTNHQTLPMSLVWTFVCLAARFGFEARPVGYPGTVIAAIRLPESEEWLYINPFREELTTQTESEISVSLQPGFPRDFVQPATTQSIITRAINNVFVSAMRDTTVQWLALYLVTAFFNSQGIRDNTTNALWSFILQTANERAPLDLIPIIHDRLLGPEGTSPSPAEATLALLQAVNLKCGEDERPPRVVRAHDGGPEHEERRIAVGMMIGLSVFIVGFTERARWVILLDCRNKEEPISKSREHSARVFASNLRQMLTESRGIPLLDRHRSVESPCVRSGSTTIRGRFIRDRHGGCQSSWGQ